MPDIAFQSACDLVQAIKTRKIAAAELLELYIERMQKYNPQINAIVATDLDHARRRARAADQALDQGEDWGTLSRGPDGHSLRGTNRKQIGRFCCPARF